MRAAAAATHAAATFVGKKCVGLDWFVFSLISTSPLSFVYRDWASACHSVSFTLHNCCFVPRLMFIFPGVLSAHRGALEKAGLSLGQVDLFEINEAFAAQFLACQRELDLNLCVCVV